MVRYTIGLSDVPSKVHSDIVRSDKRKASDRIIQAGTHISGCLSQCQYQTKAT